MPFLQIRPAIPDLPLLRRVYGLKYEGTHRFTGNIAQTRAFISTHLPSLPEDGRNADPRPTNTAITSYQRSPDEIPLMETHSLTAAMMRSSKSGFFKKNTWDKYVARSLELRDKFSAKNLAIVMISAAKASVKDRNFYDLMAERLITKSRNYVNTYKLDPAAFFANNYKAEFTAFNVYTILTACSVAEYTNEELLKALLKVSEIKLLYFNDFLDRAVNSHRPSLVSDSTALEERDDRFTFEDLAGILHAYSASAVEIPHMTKGYSDTFKKMYHIAKNREVGEAIQLGEPAQKSFAIAFNSLVKLGERSEELYNIGLDYLLKNMDSLGITDLTMAYSALVKIRVTTPEFEDLSGLLPEVTDNLLEKISGVKIDLDSLISLSSTFVNILGSQIFERAQREALIFKFNTLFTEAVFLALAEYEVGRSSLVQLLHNATLLSATPVAMAALSNPTLKTVGLKGSKLDVVKLVTSLNAMYSTTDSKCLKDLAAEHMVMAVRQYGKRLTYVLNPHSLPLSKTKARPPDLYTMLKLESKGLLDAQATDINTDWKELTSDISEFTPDNINTLATILNSLGKFTQSKYLSKFVSLASDYCTKFFKFHTQLDSNPLQMDTVAAIVNTLSRYRVKNRSLMENFSMLIIGDLQSRLSSGSLEHINYVSLFNIVHSYAKLGLPENKLFGIPSEGSARRDCGRNDVHSAMFRTISTLISQSSLDSVNLQMVVNCLYGLSLVGFDKFSRIAVVRLLDRFAKKTLPDHTSQLTEGTTKEIAKDSQIWGYLRELNTHCNPTPRGNAELYSQIDIFTMMLHLMAREDFFKTRVFRAYSTRMKKVLSGKGNKYRGFAKASQEKGTSTLVKSSQLQSLPSDPVKMSGLHRSVLTSLKKTFHGLRSEVPWRNGTYYVDVEVREGRFRRLVEIDGPYHYYSHTSELVSASRAKHFIITKYGGKLVHIPYFEWAKCEDDSARLNYISAKVRGSRLSKTK